MTQPAWTDDDDGIADEKPSTHPYQVASSLVPSWALASTKAVNRKRERDIDADVADILASDSALSSGHNAADSPKLVGRIGTGRYGNITDVCWTSVGALALTAHAKHVIAWQPQTSKIDLLHAFPIPQSSKPVRQITSLNDGSAAVLVHEGRNECPSLLNLDVATPTLTPLAFMTKAFNSSPLRVTSGAHQLRRKKGGRSIEEIVDVVSRFVMNPEGSLNAFAVSLNESVWLGAIDDGSMHDCIRCVDNVVGLGFASPDHLVIATQKSALLYDVRTVSSGPVATVKCQGTKISAVAAKSNLIALGHENGELLVFSTSGGRFTKPIATFDSLRTEIDLVDFGKPGGHTATAMSGRGAVCFASSLQMGGIRHALLPESIISKKFPFGSASKSFPTALSCFDASLFAVVQEHRSLSIFSH